MPSTFEEDLDIREFSEVHEYPVATATHKAIQVYEKLVVSRLFWLFRSCSILLLIYLIMKEENPDNAPDIVIAGAIVFHNRSAYIAFTPGLLSLFSADTVVFTHAQPITSDTAYSVLPDVNQELLEKPSSKEDNLRMLLDLNGGVCEVVTGLVVGATFLTSWFLTSDI